jgi:geranylgeranyl reductase family protein
MERRPVIIIGSGPAGSGAALYLHQRDRALAADTLILEKATHPRPKVCAGGVIPAAVRCLHQVDVELSVPHVTVHRARVVTPTRTVEHEDRDLCHVIRRAEFDASLVQACKERGLAVNENEPVVELARDAEGVRVVTKRAEYHARLVIGADGSGSLVRRRLVDAEKGQTGRAVMADVPVEELDWDGFRSQRYDFDFRDVRQGMQGYCWAFPCLIDGRPYANVGAYSVTPRGAALDAAMRRFTDSVGAHSVRRSAFPIRWYRRGSRLAAPHVLLAGDAAGVDPLMGEGISLALEYGELVAEAAVSALRNGDFSGAAYQRAVEASWLGKKLHRLHLGTRLFYGPAWRACFAIAERSTRARSIGLRWYNGVDGWDRRSGWAAVTALLSGHLESAPSGRPRM